jgi:hypothetical protein
MVGMGQQAVLGHGDHPGLNTPVMALPPEDRHDRAKVNEAVRPYQRDQRPGDRSK